MAEMTPPKFIGPAGEALVRFDLLRRGIQVHSSTPGSSFDVVVELPNGRLVKMEVKTCGAPKTRKAEARGAGKKRQVGRTRLAYVFGLAGKAKGNRGVEVNKDKYSPVEVFAFVALDIQKVLYYRWFDINRRAVSKIIGVSLFDMADCSFLDCFGPIDGA